MAYFISFLFLFITTDMMLFDFQADCELDDWRVVDDVVMGGRSDGDFLINEAGHGVFHGTVSLENNGGFSSVRYRFSTLKATPYQKFVIRLRGDGKRYQFRVKSDNRDRHSYITYFETSGEWETIELSFADFAPAFRGRDLNMPHYPGQWMEEVAFLIGNKKPQQFQLEIDWIKLADMQ